MPFEIVRNDITNMQVDAIVNTANPHRVIGAGTDARIHEKAGPQLLQARQRLGNIRVGEAAVTPAYDLPAKYVIHTVGPVWKGGSSGEEAALRSCYGRCLELALEKECRSVAFPLIATGNYGFPKDKALRIAMDAFSAFLAENDLHIYLVVYDRAAFKLSEKLFRGIQSYIDENYIETHQPQLYGFTGRALHRRREVEICEDREIPQTFFPAAAMPAAKSISLDDYLKKADAGFSETLLKLIDRTGKKDSEIYKKANISKQHFSKIRNNPDYKPTKPTAIALALALELNLEETGDLIGRAGYTLTNSSKFDLIIRYFIERGNYNVVEINVALYEFDQVLLGN